MTHKDTLPQTGDIFSTCAGNILLVLDVHDSAMRVKQLSFGAFHGETFTWRPVYSPGDTIIHRTVGQFDPRA